MPRVKTIRVSEGEEGRGYGGYGASVSISGERDNANAARLDIAEAVTLEHDCDSSSCDICAAWWMGYPLAAAHLLSGATETPLLDKVMAYYRVSQIDWPEEWDDWVKQYESVTWECDCGAHVWDSDICDNCLATKGGTDAS